MGFYEKYFDLGLLDNLSYRHSPIHSLDSRIKLATTLLFMTIVVSFPKYELTGLVPLFIYPVMLLSLADLPAFLIFKKVLAVSPFAILLGISNPIFDHRVMCICGGLQLSGGWISFFSLLLKFSLTVSAGLILIATTSFPGICSALERLKAPKILVLQLLLLYRFLFVLIDEAYRMLRAKDARDVSGRGLTFSVYKRLLGALFLRTIDRAQRIYLAISSRDPGGHSRFVSEEKKKADLRNLLYLFVWSLFFVLCRMFNFSDLIGTAAFKMVS